MSLINSMVKPIKRDSLGRRRHPNQNNTRDPAIYKVGIGNVRLTDEMLKRLKLAAKCDSKTMSVKLREYIEWGLENDKVD